MIPLLRGVNKILLIATYSSFQWIVRKGFPEATCLSIKLKYSMVNY